METTKTTGLAVSEQTANYITAIRDLNTAGSSIITALVEHYGDKQGDDLYQKYFAPLYEDLRKQIGDFLTQSVEEFAGNRNTPNII